MAKVDFVDLLKSTNTLLPSMTQEDKQSALQIIRNRLVEQARTSFYTYVQLMAPLVLPEGFTDGRHIRLMCSELQMVESKTFTGARGRLMLNCPPGAMKSKLINLFVSWCFGRHPKWNILHIGHSTQFVEDNSGAPIRDIMKSPEYYTIFPNTQIRSDKRASGRWETTHGGKYYGTGVGSAIAGRRAHIAVCDDVVSEQTAYSKLERTKINEWYVPGLRTRLLPNGSEINVQTRWHLDDLAGYLDRLDKHSKVPWRKVIIPAILDKPAAELLSKNEGESFWPEFQPLSFLEERRDSLSAQKWSALYMQNPVPEEGSIFKEADFQMWPDLEPPGCKYLIVSVDGAFSTRETADFSAFTVWGIYDKHEVDLKGREILIPNLILLDSEKGRWEFSDLCEKIHEVNDIYEPDVIVVEKKASGQSLIQELRRRGLPIVEYLPDRDKQTRAHATTPFFKSKRIWLPANRSFAKELLTEALQFPYGSHDDLTDTMTQAILHVRDTWHLSNSRYLSELLDDPEDRPVKQRKTYWQLVGHA